MNERIKELAEQANDFADNNYRNTPNIINGEEWSPCKRDNWRELMQEKFAELIIRECMNAVCDPRTTYLESMTESSAMYAARERIRKHFGG